MTAFTYDYYTNNSLVVATFIIHLFQWAYGVTCWEIFSGGKVPYPSVNIIDLPRYLANGHRQEQPNNCACNDEM